MNIIPKKLLLLLSLQTVCHAKYSARHIYGYSKTMCADSISSLSKFVQGVNGLIVIIIIHISEYFKTWFYLFLGIFAFVKINWNKLDNGLWDSELDVCTRKLQQFYNCKKLQYIKSVVVPNTTGINYRMKCSINVLPDAIVVCLHNEFWRKYLRKWDRKYGMTATAPVMNMCRSSCPVIRNTMFIVYECL